MQYPVLQNNVIQYYKKMQCVSRRSGDKKKYCIFYLRKILMLWRLMIIFKSLLNSLSFPIDVAEIKFLWLEG